MSTEVEVCRVRLSLGGNQILTDVDLTVPRGSFVTLLGPSGSGKTTTLNVVAGFHRPDSGGIQMDGREITHLPPGARDLGMVFQNYAIFPHMTVGENIAFPLVAQGIRRGRRRRVEEMLELVKLPGFKNRKGGTLSGGQLQRVALARALAPNPKLLLLDEPLSALDKQLREAMQGELKSIQREIGVTTISVTHDQAEALSMSDHVVVMNDGRVEQQGTTEEVYCRPSTAFMAQFLGEVNLLPVAPNGLCAPLEVSDRTQIGRLLVVRPEDFHLGAETMPGFDATVSTVQFHGGTVRVEARTQGVGPPLIVRSAYAGLGTLPQPGERVRIGYRLKDLHFVDPEPAEVSRTIQNPQQGEPPNAADPHPLNDEASANRSVGIQRAGG